MYFTTFEFEGRQMVGIQERRGGAIIPADKAFVELGMEAPIDMNSLICIADEGVISKIRQAVKNEELKKEALDERAVDIKAPIPYPRRNIICLGKNYSEHAKEIEGTDVDRGNELPSSPIYFSKMADPAIAGGDMVEYDEAITGQVDYEVELAVIIGKDGRDIKKEEVRDYIFGYTIVNDISARDLQAEHKQWFRGKSLANFCPMGPCIVHKSCIGYPVQLDIKCSVNGELRQNANTRDMIFDIDYIISDLSRGMYLRAGDIIITGTPSGVALGSNSFEYLKDGDVVKCEIEGIGSISNVVRTL